MIFECLGVQIMSDALLAKTMVECHTDGGHDLRKLSSSISSHILAILGVRKYEWVKYKFKFISWTVDIPL